jgi:hypothetical protein
MDKSLNNNFTIACDMDDVLMVPHTYVEFSNFLGINDVFSAPLIQYKAGRRSYESLLNNWFNIMSSISIKDKQEAVKYVVSTISEQTFQFVKKSNELGRFVIVSNNDGDLVESIAGKLNVEYIAVNKYIFKYRFVTQRKSQAIKNQKIKIDTAITDDPVNEKDFLDLPGYKNNIIRGIVLGKVGIQHPKTKKYEIVNTLNEVYEKVFEIKCELMKF